MKTTHFVNNGALDERAFTVMGMSAKDDSSAIGQFGTGLKYAISGILRTGGKIEIKTGNAIYKFSLEDEEMRGKEFQRVHCNGEPLAYTTEYGLHWEAWQWFRELYSNALDENGEALYGDDVRMEKFDTVITVEHEAIHQCLVDKSKFFFSSNDATPIVANHLCEVFPHNGTNAVYYKGVRVAQWETVFTYNILSDANLKLTEDRTLEYPWRAQQAIGKTLGLLTNSSQINLALTEENASFEGHLTSDAVSDEFINMVREKLLESPNAKLPVGLRNLYVDRCGAFTREALDLTPRENKQVEKAKTFLELIGYEVTAPIIKVESKGDSLYGQAEDGEIWVTQKAFEHGTFDLAATLLEEQVHLNTGHGDCDRPMQDYLFRQIILMGEKLVDDVL